jgi:hypothetical protein
MLTVEPLALNWLVLFQLPVCVHGGWEEASRFLLFSIATPFFFLSLSTTRLAKWVAPPLSPQAEKEKKNVYTHREKKEKRFDRDTHSGVGKFQPYAHAYLGLGYSGERSPMRLCIYSDTTSTGPAYISLPNSFVFGRGFFLFFLFFYIYFLYLFIYLFIYFYLSLSWRPAGCRAKNTELNLHNTSHKTPTTRYYVSSVLCFLRSWIFLFLFHGFAQKPNEKKLFALSSSGERPNNKRTSTGRTNKKTTSRRGGETKRVIGQVINLVNKKPKIVCLFLDISLCVSFLFV